MNRALPARGSDKRAEKKEKIPVCSASPAPAALPLRTGAARRPGPPPRRAPLNHASDHRHRDSRLLRFGFQSGGAAASGRQAGAPTPGSEGPRGGPLFWGPGDPRSLMRYPTEERTNLLASGTLVGAFVFFVLMAQGPYLKDSDLEDPLILCIPHILACGVPYSS